MQETEDKTLKNTWCLLLQYALWVWCWSSTLFTVILTFLLFLGIHLKRSLNRNAVVSASKQKQILKKFFEITSRVSMTLLFWALYTGFVPLDEVMKLMMQEWYVVLPLSPSDAEGFMILSCLWMNEKKLQDLIRTTEQSSRTKTANVTKDDITCAAHCQHVSVLQSNIFCHICCFSSVTFLCRPYKVLCKLLSLFINICCVRGLYGPLWA